MAKSQAFYSEHKLTSPCHFDLTNHQNKIYHQMAKLVHDLQGNTESDLSLADDVDLDDVTDDVRLPTKRCNVKSSLCFKSSLSEAVADGDRKLVRRLVLSSTGHTGRKSLLTSALAEAIDTGQVEIVRIFLEGKAKATGSFRSQSHLVRAVRGGHVDIVKELIAAGANVNADVNNDDTCYYNDNNDNNNNSNKTLLHIAASSSSGKMIQCLLDNGCHIDAKDSIQGNTALHVACSYSNSEAVCVLVGNGAEYNTPNWNSATPLAKLLVHVTKNNQDWHNAKRLQMARHLIRAGLMIFRSHDVIDPDLQNIRASKRTQHVLSLYSSPLPTSPMLPLPQIRTNNRSGLGTTHSKFTNSKSRPEDMLFPCLIKSMEQSDEDNENADDFLSSSSSSLSSSLDSSSSSSSRTESHDISPSALCQQRSRSFPWWQKKEMKLSQLFDRLTSETRSDWTLQQHCRLRIIRCLETRSMQQSVTLLALPQMVQRYVIDGNLGWDEKL